MYNSQFSTILGKLIHYPDFPTQLIQPRHVDIWLPPEYTSESDRRFPVLYMHDGQNLFDPAIAFTGTDWGIDENIVLLTRQGKISPPLVVGVWNIDTRWLDYIPQKPLETPRGQAYKVQAQKKYGDTFEGAIHTDAYLRFLVTELKPFVDQTYRTLPGQADTCVMGSSMGGLASLYALCEYPQVFRGAACLSTHWPAGEELFVDWFGATLPAPENHLVYFDYGTENLDALYEPYQAQMNALMHQHGYTQNVNWVTLKFPGADHNEASWRERVHIPLEFLYKH